MKHISRTTVFLLCIYLLFSATTNCQTYGKILTKSEANQMFGAVNFSVTITAADMQNLLNQTDKVLMFNFNDGNLIVLGDGRTSLSPSTESVNPDEVFKVYSKSIISELINLGGSDSVFVEQRQNALTITNGEFTLEFATECPPICP